MPRIRSRRANDAISSLPWLLSTFVLFTITMPCCLIHFTDVRTQVWHRLPPVDAGIPVSKWQGANSASEPWRESAQISMDLFRNNGATELFLRGKPYEIDGEFLPEIRSCIQPISSTGNLHDLGNHLEAFHEYIQSKWKLPNHADDANPLSVLLRVDRDVPMTDVERVVETIENAGVSKIGYAGWLAKNP